MSALAVRSERLDTLRTQLKTLPEPPSADLLRFVEAFYAEVLPTEFVSLAPATLLSIARFAWDTANARMPGEPIIRLEPLERDPAQATGRRMVLCIVNDDMPFLVDSVSAELAARHIRVERLLHPILEAPTRPARESFMYFELGRLAARDRQDLVARLHEILATVRQCVADWRPMLAKLKQVSVELKQRPAPVAPNELQETQAFIDWLGDDHFTLLGYRYYQFADADVAGFSTQEGLGVLRDPDYPIWRGRDGFVAFSPDLLAFLKAPQPVLITKTNSRSVVHRRVHMDYVGFKSFDSDGRVIGEHRFVGLFTSSAYAQSPGEMPLVRRKVAKVIDACGFDPKSHAGKTLSHVLDTFPRDEMIQMDVEALTATALGLLSLMERPRAFAFIRRDPFERFVSVLAYVPRDAYRSDIREQIAAMLTRAFNAWLSMYSVELGDEGLARVHYILGQRPGEVTDISDQEVNEKLDALVRGWDERLEQALSESESQVQATRLFLTYGSHFSASYRAQFDAIEAAADIQRLASLDSDTQRALAFYRRPEDAPHHLRLKLYQLGTVMALSDCVPVLENFGLKVIDEYPFDLKNGELGWIQDFLLEQRSGAVIDLDQCGARLQEAMLAVFAGDVENDGFNALVTATSADAQQIVWLRAIFRYLRQIGVSLGLDTVRATLLRYAPLTQALLDLFQARFLPDLDASARAAREAAALEALAQGLQNVESLEDDRALRLYQAVIQATLRTNAFQSPHPSALALKIRSADVPGVPLPIPHVEIFVYAPRVEGVHLRGGKVARGGLRWSDRRDDFRTEILGLLKAQMVKNAVIVPVGAKGGFYPKHLPPASDRDAWLAEGVACYKIFITSLLSITDNLKDGNIVAPAQVVRHDGDDPYLVVAADKGTATFSDIANQLAIDHGFWLGDAFASGGSNGYDHKKMGITAKGAWISVERHFREKGLNVATDPITVIGVGDMSGDVFGNGLLRSKAVKLVAAFDHRHIFLDPSPDPAASFAERQRLFDLPRSSWADYNADLVSPGGAIIARSAKSVTLSSQVQSLLGVSTSVLTPNEVIQAILKAPADLLWLGGIGTYIKAAAESHADAGDKANDAVRIDAEDLQVKAIGEGANLGITQKGRMSFAAKGGAVNTDFIDNSAGVDCSDNEVNLKILLNSAVARSALTPDARDALLKELTDAISALVLRDNYLQTQAITLAHARAKTSLAAHRRLIKTLEADYGLHRKVEGLPSDAELAERAKAGAGLTRPELAVLLSHAKLALKSAILSGTVPDDDAVRDDLAQAFPEAIQQRFADEIACHQLRREIVATKLSNQIVNRGGLTLAFDLQLATGQSLERVAAAFVAVRECFSLRSLWRLIDSYDYQIAASLQIDLQTRASAVLRGQVMRFLAYEGDWSRVANIVERLRPGVVNLLRVLNETPVEQAWVDLQAQGAPADVVRLLATLDRADDAAPIAELTARAPVSEAVVLDVTRHVDSALGLDWLAKQLDGLRLTDPWDRLAAHALASDLLEARFARASQFVESGDMPRAAQDWLRVPNAAGRRLESSIADLKAIPDITLSMLTHAVALARLALA